MDLWFEVRGFAIRSLMVGASLREEPVGPSGSPNGEVKRLPKSDHSLEPLTFRGVTTCSLSASAPGCEVNAPSRSVPGNGEGRAGTNRTKLKYRKLQNASLLVQISTHKLGVLGRVATKQLNLQTAQAAKWIVFQFLEPEPKS